MSKKFLLTAMLGLCIGIVGMGLSACGSEEENSSKPPVQGTTPSVNGGLNGGGTNNGGNMNNGCAHSLKEEVTKAATCEETGELVRSCSLCGESMTVTIPALGHAWSEYESDRNGTLTANGTQTAECTRDGCDKTNTIEEPNSKRENGILFKTLKGSGTNLSVTFENDVEMYSFLNEVEIFGNATYTVSYDLAGMDEISTKTLSLNEGDNIVYVWEYVNGSLFNMYTVNLHRKAICTVEFACEGMESVFITVVEGNKVTPPSNPHKVGYTFKGWDYDCSQPIMESITINAVWEANTDTEYIVEYYYENIQDEGYTCEETDYLTGTTDTTASLDVGDKEHFTLNTEMSTLSGNIEGNGSLVLQVYYDRREYTVTFEMQGTNSMYAAAVGTHKYGTEISTAVDNVQAGFEAVWYAGETPFIMNEETYLIDRDFDIRIETRAEMANFEFELSKGECKITGVKDKTVKEIIVPDYVTWIEYGAFNGCSNVVSMELPFVGRYEDTEDMQVLFGYIFGSEYYEGAQNVSQHYYESSTTTSSRGFYIPNSLTSVKVRGGEIAAFAFEGCTYLQEVTLGEGVTKIRESAFDNCRGLKKIVISDSVLTIEKSAFSGCKKLERVTIGDGVTSIGEKAFYGCHALMDLIIGDSVTSIGKSAFSNCYALMRVTIGEKVRSIGDYAFESSRKLVEIYNKSSLSFTIGGSDYGYVARDAKNIYTPTEGASKLSTDEEGYVLYKDGADTVVIGYVGTETALTLPVGVTEINQYAFYLAGEITSVEIPDSVILVGDRAFQNCTKMTDVTIGDGVTDIGEQAFYNCTNLSNITIGESVTYISSYAFNETAYYKDENNWDNGVLYVGDCLYTSNNTLTGEYTVKEGTRCIISGAFLRNTGLTGISIPDSVTYIGENAFNGCNSLMSVYITDLEDWMRISFAEYDANPLRHGGNLYVDGELLTELNVNCDVGNYAFYGCTGLTSLTIGNGTTSIGEEAFCGCSGLTDIVVSDSVAAVGNYAFDNAYPVRVTAPAIVFVSMKKDNLETVTITSGNISEWLFSKAQSLKSVELLDGVTSIDSYAFANCSALTNVTIGSGVTSIDSYAFINCSVLTTITFEGTISQWEAIEKSGHWKLNAPITEVVCSDGKVTL